ncbi:hypothetical protein [Psychromonas algicola]|uniref:hypothetical protein n=1 Tax=Psychromonas algicola TaxID=2555642 RepID=UPI0010686A42|nr:hypothetical protein [Psychromonas sp. RZ5]TEW43039.1 hypothetical protein E2R67_16170 [Psychromonas sp. RZ5]
MNNIEVKNAPNALLSRNILSKVSPIKENRKGSRFLALIYVLLGVGMTIATVLILAAFNVPLFFYLFTLLWLPFTILMIGYEQSLIVQNHRTLFLKYIAQHFNRDEKFLQKYGTKVWDIH